MRVLQGAAVCMPAPTVGPPAPNNTLRSYPEAQGNTRPFQNDFTSLNPREYTCIKKYCLLLGHLSSIRWNTRDIRNRRQIWKGSIPARANSWSVQQLFVVQAMQARIPTAQWDGNWEAMGLTAGGRKHLWWTENGCLLSHMSMIWNQCHGPDTCWSSNGSHAGEQGWAVEMELKHDKSTQHAFHPPCSTSGKHTHSRGRVLTAGAWGKPEPHSHASVTALSCPSHSRGGLWSASPVVAMLGGHTHEQEAHPALLGSVTWLSAKWREDRGFQAPETRNGSWNLTVAARFLKVSLKI